VAIDEQDWGGHTALWYASYFGRLSAVRVLLERGADPTLADQDGPTPLMAACDSGQIRVVRVLLAHPSAQATTTTRLTRAGRR
jgi:ankyrin repeat protein